MPLRMRSLNANREQAAEHIRHLFNRNMEKSGRISMQHLEMLVEDEEVLAHFAVMDLDPSDTYTLFLLMDFDQSGHIDIEEFIVGCMHLKGGARALDIAKVSRDCTLIMQNLRKMMLHIDECFGDLFGLMAEERFGRASTRKISRPTPQPDNAWQHPPRITLHNRRQ